MHWFGVSICEKVIAIFMYQLFINLFTDISITCYRNNSPSALELKCIEVWLISCTMFVFFALLEYFIVLFGIRYDKHWRHKKKDLDLERINLANNHVAAPPKIDRLRLFGTSKVQPQDHARSDLKDNVPGPRDDLQRVNIFLFNYSAVY